MTLITINIKLPINSVIIIEIIHEYRGYWHWYIRMWGNPIDGVSNPFMVIYRDGKIVGFTTLT